MILSDKKLHELLDSGVIVGAKRGAVNAASIDVHLGGSFLHEKPGASTLNLRTVNLKDREPLLFRKQQLSYGSTTFLDPGEFCLAATEESFNLPNNLSAWFVLKSSIARSGLNQLSAVWCDSGWTGSVLTLELSNVTRFHRLELEVGMPIGQMVFHEHEPVSPENSYAVRGRYNHDMKAMGVKP